MSVKFVAGEEYGKYLEGEREMLKKVVPLLTQK
jgi:hypothetical protein